MKENWAALIYAIISPDYCSVNKALNTMGIHFKYKKKKRTLCRGFKTQNKLGFIK